jgi:hypothetical protein
MVITAYPFFKHLSGDEYSFLSWQQIIFAVGMLVVSILLVLLKHIGKSRS